MKNLLDSRLNAAYNSTTDKKPRNRLKDWLTPEIIEMIDSLVQRGLNPKEIASAIEIDFPKVEAYIGKVRKKYQAYNLGHKEDKDAFTNEIIMEFAPASVLDLFAGIKSVYVGKCLGLLSNDIRPDTEADEQMDALKLLHRLAYEGKKFDMVDLDVYGSAYKYLPAALEVCKKVLVVTIGEIKMKRYGWDSYGKFAKDIYNIESEEEFTIEGIIEGIQHVAKHCGYTLDFHDYRKWAGCGRVCFTVR